MYYNELIQFDPIETTIQLIESDDKAKAQEFTSTFVISDDMALNITKIAFEQLQFDHPSDNKGLLWKRYSYERAGYQSKRKNNFAIPIRFTRAVNSELKR